jgi:hypothetical protein
MVVMLETVDWEALVVPVVPRLVVARTAETVVLPALRARPVLAEALLPVALLVGKATVVMAAMVAMDLHPLLRALMAATVVLAALVVTLMDLAMQV